MIHHPYSGLLIAFEGIDGSGKSTAAQMLTTALSARYKLLLTKEPGGTALGKELRTMLQYQHVHVCPQAEYLLFAADRAEHMKQVIIPALQEKTIVISDRMADSSVVYQGYGRGVDMQMITNINAWAMQGYKPDVTIFIDVPLTVAQQRWKSRNQSLTTFEQNNEFMERVQQGFYALYKDRTDVILIDGTEPLDKILATILTLLEPWIHRYEQQTDTSGTTLDRQSRPSY